MAKSKQGRVTGHVPRTSRAVSVSEAREGFADLINRVAYGQDRVGINRRGKTVAVLVSAEDAELLEQLEDAAADLEAVRKALAEDDGQRVTLAELKAELGL
jgi:prevent-host-death family protein